MGALNKLPGSPVEPKSNRQGEHAYEFNLVALLAQSSRAFQAFL